MALMLRRVSIVQRPLYSVVKRSLSRLSSAQDFARDASNPTITSEVKENDGKSDVNIAKDEREISVGEYAMKIMKELEGQGKLKTKRRSVWLIRRHMDVVEKFCQTPKQVLGLSLAEFKRRLEVLQELELSHEDSLVIAMTYPSCLSLDPQTMLPMVSLLKKYGCYLPKHLIKNPYVFSLDAQHCELNLKQLKKTGLSSESIGNLIDINPIVLTVPLSKTVEDFALHARNYQSPSNILRLALKTSLLKSGEQVSLSEDFEEVLSFLHELNIDLSRLMQKCPEFLCSPHNHLLETYQFLSGSPLYCEKNHIKKLVTSNPHAFLQMNKSSFQQSIRSLAKIVDSNVKLYYLLRKSPMLFVDSSSILLERIELLTKHQFSRKEIVGLLERAAFVFSDEKSSSNLENKLQLLLAEKDITTNQVCKSALILRAPLEKIQKRLFFIRNRKPDVLKKYSLNEILFSSNQAFLSDICGSSLKEYLSTVELVDSFKFPRTEKK